MSRSRDSKRIRCKEFFRDFGSDLILFEKIKYSFVELCCIFFEDLGIVDKIVFVDQEEYPFFDHQFAFFVDIQGNHIVVISNLDFYRVGIFAQFGTCIPTNFFQQVWYLCDSLIISSNISNQTKYSRFEDMTKKRVSESSPFCSTFYQSWNIYDIEMGLLDRYRSEIRYQGCEWIVSDFRFGIRDTIDDAGFSHTRRPD